ncbi:Co2+ Mg2+ efflux [Micractinium conductrix]|uniref:Co2+ Mg2+ efflux n=1 Tax=Micractinium conductrix TaxID=554055 RepID=A0A2P6VL70_9CHLO|nr:Co2+ Mg2+ efflux [Micractinium conductrix]|eukprot:PSC74841.1 Co2+ Mg2+ efflux [Micractinium conductrix]
MSVRATRAVYRLLLRQARALDQEGVQQLDIRMPVDKEAWLGRSGGHGWSKPRDEFHLESLRRLAPWVAEGATSGSFSPAQLRALVTRCFRHPPAGSSADDRIDWAFQSLRLLSEQIQMQRCSSSAETEGVHVEVTTAHVGSQGELDPTFDPDEEGPEKEFYTYRVRVSNCGKDVVQLLGRHWIIENDKGEVVAEVARGSTGVVGCTPIIKPGECFSYYSGTDVEPPGRGAMHGSFQMAVVDPQRPQQVLRKFDAEIAPFPFVPPAGGTPGAA